MEKKKKMKKFTPLPQLYNFLLSGGSISRVLYYPAPASHSYFCQALSNSKSEKTGKGIFYNKNTK